MKQGYKKMFWVVLMLVVTGVLFLVLQRQYGNPQKEKNGCFTGAFLTDNPGKADILSFQKAYGKKPYFVLMFTDWNSFPDSGSIKEILEESSCPIITWEPWEDYSVPVDPAKILTGGYDEYIREFALKIGSFEGEVMIRFAHEMNGDWYPWAGSVIGAENYKKMYRYVKDIFDDAGVRNVKWIFSVNWEDVPKTAGNDMMNYYPGDEYADYIGIDGYNWGTAREWSKWRSFRDIFSKTYKKLVEELGKPVIISEFSSVSEGGNKAQWIRQAMRDIRSWNEIKGFVLFNVDKEADWMFPADKKCGMEFGREIGDPYFKDKGGDDR